MDKTTIPGVLFGIGMILLGQKLEGGHAGSLIQATAFIIVIGGTMGAVFVSYPLGEVISSIKGIKLALQEKPNDTVSLIGQLVELATIARRDGVLALEGKLAEVKDPFLKRSLGFLVDGVEATVARDTLETEIEIEAEEDTVKAKFWGDFGALCPTVGVLGAVLGLIHVMENLDNPAALGPGIAVAFVATVYGVGVANLVALPISNKIKRKIALEKERKTLIAEGVLAIQEGLNPRILEEKLKSYGGHHARHMKPGDKK
ncbi:MAG: flagellar motor protein [Myxococcales bacterium]|nr:flagellar motor protein [Myxococcales bacterium]